MADNQKYVRRINKMTKSSCIWSVFECWYLMKTIESVGTTQPLCTEYDNDVMKTLNDVSETSLELCRKTWFSKIAWKLLLLGLSGKYKKQKLDQYQVYVMVTFRIRLSQTGPSFGIYEWNTIPESINV